MPIWLRVWLNINCHQMYLESFLNGSGYGEDHTLWGAECLIGDLQSYQRVGSIHPILLPGGEFAIHEIKRIAISLCVMSRHPFPSACVEQEIVSLCQHPSLVSLPAAWDVCLTVFMLC